MAAPGASVEDERGRVRCRLVGEVNVAGLLPDEWRRPWTPEPWRNSRQVVAQGKLDTFRNIPARASPLMMLNKRLTTGAPLMSPERPRWAPSTIHTTGLALRRVAESGGRLGDDRAPQHRCVGGARGSDDLG